KVYPQVSAIGPPQVRKRLRESGNVSLRQGTRSRHEHADPPHAAGLLRACRERPRRHAADKRDKFASPNARHGGLLREQTSLPIKGTPSAPSCARPKDNTITGRQIACCTAILHCEISVASTRAFTSAQGHDPKGSG